MNVKRTLLVLSLLGLVALPAHGHDPSAKVDFYLAVDVPTDLPLPAGSTTVLPWTLTRHRNAVAPDYTLDLSPAPPLALPPPASVDACHLLNGGEWLFSVEAPMDDPGASGVTFLPGDVVRYDVSSGNYTHFFCGTPFGLPDGVNVDAAFIKSQTGIDGNLVFQRDGGNLVLSFDVPVDIGATTYLPSDLIELRFTGPACFDWVVVGRFFNSAAAGIPASYNVSAADERGGVGTNGARRVLLAFDVPADDPGSGTTYLPGDVVSWDPVAGTFDSTPFHRDPVWPIPSGPPFGYSARINALCLLAAPGTIPSVPPLKLEIDKGPGAGQITLFWSASCSIGAEDYGIHEGQIGNWYSHDEIDCIDDGADFTEVVNPANAQPGDYYLVVPHNANDEGSYGRRSVPPLAPPSERPVSTPYPNCESNGTNMRELSCP